MPSLTPWRTIASFSTGLLILALAGTAAEVTTSLPTREQVNKLIMDGNFKEGLDACTKRLRSAEVPGEELQRDLALAVQCLTRLNRLQEFDTLVDSAVELHSDDWRVLSAAATQYQQVAHHGYMIAGEFQRGQHRGGGKVMHASSRDRVRALQLCARAVVLVEADPQAADPEKARLAQQLASTLIEGRQAAASWQLQVLTNLDSLPDYDEGWGYGGGNQGAPVNEQNQPIFYATPPSWDDASNDGERWRWALEKMVQYDDEFRWTELTTRADFLRSQFGVTTLGDTLQPLLAKADGGDETSLYTLDTLRESETLARLATGVQRIALPAEHNFILLYQQALDLGAKRGPQARAHVPAERLAQLFADRRQYDRSAEYWRMTLEYAEHDAQKTNAQEQIAQIEKPWGQFETAALQPAGAGASFEYRSRNTTKVEFTAHAVKVAELLADVKAYLKSNPRELDWQQIEVGQIGHRLVQEKQGKYVGDQVAKWTVDLQPGTQHFDRRTTVASPLQKAGAYLVTSNIEGGNTASIVLWVADTAIVKKHLGDAALYYVADAVTGRPIENANVEFFAYKFERPTPEQMRVDVKQFAEFTNADGQVVVGPVDGNADQQRYQWLTTATTENGRLAYLGFHRVWRNQQNDIQPDRVKTFAITDRPVYRPEQKVHLKVWVERSKYDGPMESEFAHKTFQLEIHDPKRERILNKQLTANAYGGVVAEFDLPSTATLGQYRFHLVNYGGGTFRVEEYKKPEFEVTVDAPTEPIELGDTFDAKVTARYYFGEPVREGTVKFKVLRTTRDTQWFPIGPWDWLYGRGYWWFGYNYAWYPGWNQWGCWAPHPWWIWRQPQPPEIVAEGESPLEADGTLRISIDSSLAKELHPDRDHEYRIEAEVVDRSRRTIVGTGTVLAARKPFDVYAWTERGYYRTGDTVAASFQARRPDGEPVEGSGKLRLLSIAYEEDGRPTETEVRAWDLNTDDQGRAELQIKASDTGQFRLAYEVTSGDKSVEGGYLFTIVGPQFDGGDFRFDALRTRARQAALRAGREAPIAS